MRGRGPKEAEFGLFLLLSLFPLLSLQSDWLREWKEAEFLTFDSNSTSEFNESDVPKILITDEKRLLTLQFNTLEEMKDFFVFILMALTFIGTPRYEPFFLGGGAASGLGKFVSEVLTIRWVDLLLLMFVLALGLYIHKYILLYNMYSVN